MGLASFNRMRNEKLKKKTEEEKIEKETKKSSKKVGDK